MPHKKSQKFYIVGTKIVTKVIKDGALVFGRDRRQ